MLDLTTIDISAITSAVSLLSGFGVYLFDVRGKLLDIIRKQEGTLTKEQAEQLADLYISAVQARLETSLERYAQGQMIDHYSRGDLARIMSELERAYDSVVRKSLRPMVSSFRLRGGHRFNDVINHVSSKNVAAAFSRIKSDVESDIQRQATLDDVVLQILEKVKLANSAGRELIVSAIDRHYPKRAD